MSVRVALLVRSGNRGLGIQTRDMFRWLRPAKALHICMGQWTTLTERPQEWYPGVRSADFNGHSGTVDEDAFRWLLTDVDVLLTAETAYDHRAWDWAREMGVRTVLVANPEFLGPDKLAGVGPDVIVAPSTWQLDTIPGAFHVPQPVDREVFAFTPRPLDQSHVRFLHVVGHKAIHDRAGTEIVLDALWRTKAPVDMTIRAQEPLSAPCDLRLRQLRYERKPKVLTGDIPDPTALYAGYDVLVAPRRYGGLSLPIQEAASCGLAILATDRAPENGILPPECLVPVASSIPRPFQGGWLPLEAADPQALADALDRLASDPSLVSKLSVASDAYAASIAWPRLLPKWEAMLASVVEREPVAL